MTTDGMSNPRGLDSKGNAWEEIDGAANGKASLCAGELGPAGVLRSAGPLSEHWLD
jgi:hypothetical protein